MLRPVYGQIVASGVPKMPKYGGGVIEAEDIDLYYLLKHITGNEAQYLALFNLSSVRFRDYLAKLQDARNRFSHENLEALSDAYMGSCFAMGLSFAQATNSGWAENNLYTLQKMFDKHMQSKRNRIAQLGVRGGVSGNRPPNARPNVQRGSPGRPGRRRNTGSARSTGIDWNAVERVVGKKAADQMKQGEGFTGTLDLNDKSITDEGCRTIAPALRTMPNLKDLWLHNNNIGDEGLAVLSNVVDAIPLLDVLYLSGNKIGYVGCQCLLELIENDSLQSLTILSLRWNPNISSEELKTKFKRVWRKKGKNPNRLAI
jgi:hypothetical protein